MAEANVHILTHALHYASAVFEGERAYGGEIFKLTEHSERLVESARILEFEIPYTVAEIDQACRETVAANNLSDCYVRPIAWRGSEQMGVSAQQTKIHLAVAAWDWGSYFPMEQRLKGIRIGLAKYRRPDPATAPSKAKAAGLYMICTIEKHRAERAGFADALMLDWRGRVAECTGANIFLIKDGVIHTPDAGLLPRRHHAPHGDRARQEARATRSSSGPSSPTSSGRSPSASSRARPPRSRPCPRSATSLQAGQDLAKRCSTTTWPTFSRRRRLPPSRAALPMRHTFTAER